MSTGKTFSTKYILDSNNNKGANGQVLSSTSSGIDWVDLTDIPALGDYLPLAGGTMTAGAVVTFLNSSGSTDYRLKFGTSDQMQLFHDGAASHIVSSSSELRIDAPTFIVRVGSGTETMIKATQNAAVELYYDDTKKFETTSTGVEVTGNINAVEGVFTGDVLVSKDSPSLTLKNTTNEHTNEGAESKIVFKDHADNSLGKIEVSHNGNNDNALGNMYLQTGNGSTVVTALELNSSQNATFAGNVTLSSTAPILYLTNTTSSTGKTWRFSSAANGNAYITQDGVIDAITLSHTSGNATFAGDVSASNLSGTNTGDQDLSGYALTSAIPTDFVSAASGGTFAGTVDFSSDLNIDNALDVGGLATFNDQTSFYDDITTNGGSIGIDISPSYRLDVNGMIALSGTAIADLGTNLIKIGDVDGNGAELALYDETPAEVVRIKGGKVGINDTTPSHNLDVTGDGRFTSTVTATNFILSSDSRLKENVEDVDNKSINVDWKTFEMKSNKGQKRYGVVAQELEEVHPEFVRTDDEGMKSVAYVDLLIAKIAELEARLEKLEK